MDSQEGAKCREPKENGRRNQPPNALWAMVQNQNGNLFYILSSKHSWLEFREWAQCIVVEFRTRWVRLRKRKHSYSPGRDDSTRTHISPHQALRNHLIKHPLVPTRSSSQKGSVSPDASIDTFTPDSLLIILFLNSQSIQCGEGRS